MNTAAIAVVCLVAACLQSGHGWEEDPGFRGRNNGDEARCRSLAANGNCDFYNCFDRLQPICRLTDVNNLQLFCKNTTYVLDGNIYNRFTAEGADYIRDVHRCQMGRLVDNVNDDVCAYINTEAAFAFGLTDGLLDEDCYWQQGRFCDLSTAGSLTNSEDVSALFFSLFGGLYENFAPGPLAYHLCGHFQYLSSFCDISSQEYFHTNFINRCPRGSVDFNRQPMVMGEGGSD